MLPSRSWPKDIKFESHPSARATSCNSIVVLSASRIRDGVYPLRLNDLPCGGEGIDAFYSGILEQLLIIAQMP